MVRSALITYGLVGGHAALVRRGTHSSLPIQKLTKSWHCRVTVSRLGRHSVESRMGNDFRKCKILAADGAYGSCLRSFVEIECDFYFSSNREFVEHSLFERATAISPTPHSTARMVEEENWMRHRFLGTNFNGVINFHIVPRAIESLAAIRYGLLILWPMLAPIERNASVAQPHHVGAGVLRVDQIQFSCWRCPTNARQYVTHHFHTAHYTNWWHHVIDRPIWPVFTFQNQKINK